MSKVSATLSALIILAGLFYYGAKWRSFGGDEGGGNAFKFELPKITPLRSSRLPKPGKVGDLSVWGLTYLTSGGSPQPVEGGGEGPGSKTSGQVLYLYKKIQGVPALCKVGGKDYRWEFYGTLQRAGGLEAIFYNPARDTVKLAGSREIIDKGLVVVRLSTDEVKVRYGNKTVTLKIFVIGEHEGAHREK